MGLLSGNKIEYIFNVVRINIIFPLIILFILQQYSLEKLKKIFEGSMIISILVILIIFISSVLNAFSLFSYNFNQFFYPKEDFVGIHEGYLHVVNSSLSYLIFIIPFFFFGEKFNLGNYKIYVFFVMLIVAIISGRRILLLPFILVILFNLKQMILPILIILLSIFLIVNKNVYSSFSIDAMTERFKAALEEEGDSEVRGEQSKYFSKYIKDKPIIGYGLGSYMPDYLRSDDMPFAYEKTYDYLFFSMGIPIAVLQLLFYLFLLIKTFKNYIMIDNIRFRNAFVISIISILIASNTNPYWLSSFDYCLPLSLLMRFSENKKAEIYT